MIKRVLMKLLCILVYYVISTVVCVAIDVTLGVELVAPTVASRIAFLVTHQLTGAGWWVLVYFLFLRNKLEDRKGDNA